MSKRPVVALINNSLTPYRLHLHRRVVRELPEIDIVSPLTHTESNSPWSLDPPAEIGAVQFGPGEPSAGQSRLRYAWREWRKGGRIIRWLAALDIRAVVLGGYNDAGRLRIILWCRRRGVPCFLFGDSNVRGDTSTGWRRAVKNAVVPRVLRLCRGVFACGTLGRDYFVRYGVPPDRVTFFPYEPDYAQISSVSAEQVAAIRERFRFDPARRRIVYCGRLAPEKRVDLLIDAFAAMAAERLDWDLVVVGGGPLRAALEARVPAPLRTRVSWLGFHDDQPTLSAIYRACDVLAIPSDYEPWGVVVNEAAAADLAVVASDAVGAAADLVRDGVSGRIFPRGDLAALTHCLNDVTLPGEAERLGKAASGVLADWRAAADPVAGLRQALRKAGVIAKVNS